MTLNISNALKSFQLADYVDLDCGTFDLQVRQAAFHNDRFRAKAAQRALAAKKKSLVNDESTLTGNIEEDMKLLCEDLIVGWGTRPLRDDDGNEIEYSPVVMMEIFRMGAEGKVLFGKIQAAVADETNFAITDKDLGNS